MIDPLDRRRNAIRDDAADIGLKAQVERPLYIAPAAQRVAAPSVPCHPAPGAGAVDTEFLFGEDVQVFGVVDGDRFVPTADGAIPSGQWSWVKSTVDGYVGYVASNALDARGSAPTHVVSVPHGIVYAEPTIKQGTMGALPLGARVEVLEFVETGERFARVKGFSVDGYGHASGTPVHRAAPGEGYLLTQHLREISAPADDWVTIAERFVGAPYVWGGKTWTGIDCSGLVQLALQATGQEAPRDSDMQAAELGEVLAADAPAVRGDLVFWKGHVGIMIDAERLLHANGHHMATAIEPVRETIARLSGLGLPVTVRRRIISPT